MSSIKYLVIGIGFCLIGFSGVWGQAMPDTLHLLEIMRIAMEAHPQLNQLRVQFEAQQAQKWQAIGLPNPTVVYFKEGIGPESHFTEQRWSIEQPLPSPLRSYSGVQRWYAATQQLVYQIEALRRTIRKTVKQAYTEVLYAREVMHMREQEIELADQVLQAVRLRVEAGEATLLDQLKAEIQRSVARNNLAEAERRYHLARYDLFRKAGLMPEHQRYELLILDSLVYHPVVIRQEEVLAQLYHQPLLQAVQSQEAMHRWQIREAQAEILPAVNVSVFMQDLGTGYRYKGFQVGLQVPLWYWFNQHPRMVRVRAAFQQVRWQRRDVELALKQNIEEAWHGYDTARRRIQEFQLSIASRSEQLLQLTLEAYQIGEIDLLSLLDTQRTYLDSRIQYYQALRDFYFQLIELEQYLDRELVFPINS